MCATVKAKYGQFKRAKQNSNSSQIEENEKQKKIVPNSIEKGLMRTWRRPGKSAKKCDLLTAGTSYLSFWDRRKN